jgi:hypothetical protein
VEVKVRDWLETASEEISSQVTKTRLVHLRELQDQLELEYLITPDRNTRFLSFFVATLIDHMFYNLTGELPDNKDVSDKREEVFTSVGRALGKLARAKDDQQLTIMKTIVNTYIEGIGQINNTYQKSSEVQNVHG